MAIKILIQTWNSSRRSYSPSDKSKAGNFEVMVKKVEETGHIMGVSEGWVFRPILTLAGLNLNWIDYMVG